MLFRIGEAARRLGIASSTLRDLENRGYITARRNWVGWRVFDEQDLRKLESKLYPGDGAKSIIRRKKCPSPMN